MGNRALFWSYVMVFIAITFWGFSFIWSKQLLGVMGGVSIIFFRVIVAIVSLTLIGKMTGFLKRVERKDIPRFMLIALVQPFLYFIFELSSMKYNSPTITALVIAQIPLFIALIDLFVYKKRLTANIITGIVVSLIGVSCVILGGDDITAIMTTPLGLMLAFLAMVFAIAYNFFVQKVVAKYNPFTVTAYIHYIAFFYFLPLFFIMEWDSVKNLTFTYDIISSLMFLGVFCSAVAYMFYLYGVKNLGITVSSMINNLSPAVTALGGFIIFGENLSWLQILGIFVTIIGLMVGVAPTKKTKQ